MPKEVNVENIKVQNNWKQHSTGGGFYFLGFLGAFVYYLVNAETFWIGVLGFLKALVWPAILIYKLFQFLGM